LASSPTPQQAALGVNVLADGHACLGGMFWQASSSSRIFLLTPFTTTFVVE
jgi:hypothetical protein